MKEEHKLITVSEIAIKLGVTPQTIKNYISSGALKAIKVGSRLYLDKDAVNSLLFQLSDTISMSKKLTDLQRNIEEETKKKEKQLWGLENANSILYFLNRVHYSKELMIAIVQSIGTRHLTERQLNIIISYLRGDSPDDIAKKYNLTRARIYMIVVKAIKLIGQVESYSSLEDTIDKLKKESEIKDSMIINLKETIDELQKKLEDRTEENSDSTFTKEDKDMISLLNTPIEEFSISVRSLKRLKWADINTLGDLVKYNKLDLLKIRNFGRKSLRQLDDLLYGLNLKWGSDYSGLYTRYADYIKNKGTNNQNN